MRSRRIATALMLTLTWMVPSFCMTAKTKKCNNSEVLSIKVESELMQTADDGNQEPEIQVFPGTNVDDPIKIIALGPLLGPMDSHSIKTDLSCSEHGVVLKATITRSANFNGAVLQNQIWRPKVVLTMKAGQDVTLQTIWSMRLTNGKVVNHAQTPPYPDRSYPISITKKIR